MEVEIAILFVESLAFAYFLEGVFSFVLEGTWFSDRSVWSSQGLF